MLKTTTKTARLPFRATPPLVPPPLLDTIKTTPQRIRFLIDNHVALIRVLRSVPTRQLRQMVWGVLPPVTDILDNACQTHACALGWAALSGDIPGLGYRRRAKGRSTLIPVVNNGRRDVPWHEVGTMFFGHETFMTVFVGSGASLTKAQVVARLQDRLQKLQLLLPARTPTPN